MTTKTWLIAFVALAIIGAGGYYSYKTFMTNPTPSEPEQTAENTATQPQVSGRDMTVGTGAEATPGSKVSVLYVGKLKDGTVFDSSAAHNNQPLIFTLGVDQLIPGFQIGVNGMKEGGERVIEIPPTLGYGDQALKDPAGKEIIPANSTIVFEIKLVKVEAAAETNKSQ